MRFIQSFDKLWTDQTKLRRKKGNLAQKHLRCKYLRQVYFRTLSFAKMDVKQVIVAKLTHS